MTVFYIGNYPLDVGVRKYHLHTYPSHNLFGAIELQRRGYNVVVPDHKASMFLSRIGRYLMLGASLKAQIKIATIAEPEDAIFSVSLDAIGLLSLLKRFGILKAKLFTLVHHPPRDSFVLRWILGANDKLFFLGRHGKAVCLRVLGTSRVPMIVLPWGPELNFFEPSPLPNGPVHVVAAGKSKRDYRVLLEAARLVPVRVTIVCPKRLMPDVPLPNNVTLIGGDNLTGQPISERDLQDIYKSATVIAIPLLDTPALAGLTSLIDAAAIGRPVIITRNANIDIDVEAEGFGYWTQPGSVQDWAQALRMAASQDTDLHAMAEKALSYAREHNIEKFTDALEAELER